MILDQLSQWQRYAAVSPRLGAAFRFLEGVTATAAAGRHDLEGDNLYALVQRYTTKPAKDCALEAHRKYADIQFMFRGRETILWSPLSLLAAVTHPYDAEKDYALFQPVVTATPLHLSDGHFAVFFPEDGHAPCGQWDGPSDVLKVVVKVRV